MSPSGMVFDLTWQRKMCYQLNMGNKHKIKRDKKQLLLPALNRPEHDLINISDIDFTRPWLVIGKPRLYGSPAEMELLISNYFEFCRENDKLPLSTELALYLDMDRQSFLNYKSQLNYRAYFGILKRANQYIEATLHNRLHTHSNFAPSIFDLKANYKWYDQPLPDGGSGSNKPSQINYIKCENLQIVGSPEDNKQLTEK